MTPATVIHFALFLFVGLIEARIHDSVGCAPDEFSCKNGQCINKLNWCDDIENCRDKSDEDYCRSELYYDPNQCADDSSLFLCNNGRCIPVEGECDGLVTCTDGSDELYCDHIVKSPNFEMSTNTPKYPENSTFQENRNRQQNAIGHSNKSNNISDSRHRHFRESLESARGWLLSEWREGTGWGEDTTRGIIALHLSGTDDIGKNKQYLMNKQLDVQILLALTKNSSKSLSLCELSHYINALSATCRNPKNFNGHNLLGVLRERVDALSQKHTFVTPYVYLTLCIHNSTKHEDILNMWKFRSRLSVADNFDMLSLSVLAVTCAIRTRSLNNPNFRSDMVDQLVEKLDKSGIPKSVHELSLVVQALTESKVDPSLWNRTEAIDYILSSQKKSGSFGDFLATYYTIPILSGRSVLDLSAHCKVNFPKVHQTGFKHSEIHVTYSLYFGYPIEMIQTIKLREYEGSNFLDVMFKAQEENPFFRFQLDETKEVPFVYSIGGVPNDAERGLYWRLYVSSSINGSDLFRYDRDIRYYFPKDNEGIVFWLRPM